MTATPRPWIVNSVTRRGTGQSYFVVIADEEGNDADRLALVPVANPDSYEQELERAALIVKAVNTHERAKDAMQSLINNNGTGAMEWAIKNAKALLADMEG